MEQYRLTKQRKLILDEMRQLNVHPTAEEFYDYTKNKLPGMGLCTIYRNLEKFTELGLIAKIKGNPVRFEGNPMPHNHVKCIKCGKVEDIASPVQIDEQEIKEKGFKLHAYAIEINGICETCQLNEPQRI